MKETHESSAKGAAETSLTKAESNEKRHTPHDRHLSIYVS